MDKKNIATIAVAKIKKQYFTPEIETILLDNQISLALESTSDVPPFGPDEIIVSKAMSGLNNNPFNA